MGADLNDYLTGEGGREDEGKRRGGLQWTVAFNGMPMQVQANDAERRGEGNV